MFQSNGLKEKQLIEFPVGVCYILEPAQCRSILVNLVLVNKETEFREVASVLIPGSSSIAGKNWRMSKLKFNRCMTMADK